VDDYWACFCERCTIVVSEDARGRVRRRLAAILVAGLSRLFPGEEKDNFTGLRAFLTDVIDPLIPKFEGNIFKHTGDLVLIEFDSVVEATRCAAALRDAVAGHNQTLPNEQRLAMRIGINLGDIIAEGGDIFGDGVNIAARIESLAEPGSIFVSEMAYHHIADKVDFDFEDLGPQNLKNITRPIRVYRMGGEIKDQSADLDPAAPALAASPSGFDDRRAIAVLPFANFSGDPEQEFFADGITEDIITMLAGWRAFPVIARNSTFNYKGQTVDIKKVGEELGVRYVLEGSVRKSGRRVRVTAQLIRADTNHHIMAERYDRDLTDLFELQDEIVTAIAGAIEPEILKFERERIVERTEHNHDAYQFYQRGMWHHYQHSKADNVEAQVYFRRALAIDAQYPQATAAVAIAICNAGYLGWTEDPERNYEESYELAQRAVILDARFPNARFALGLACMYMHRPDRAMAEMRQAIELNPSFAAAHAILGHMLTYVGRPEETIPLVERAIRLSPSDPRLFIWLPALAAAHYQLHQYDRAVEIGRRSWSLNRNWPVGLRYVVAGLAQLGRSDEARIALDELRCLDTDLASFERVARRVFQKGAPVDHILDGLRKAGMK
jgi:adenylate cyclase